MGIALKRVYEPPNTSDGVRILVERLWPRGLTREKAAIDHWAKEIAPTPALRSWYGHDPAKWPEFQKRYREELAANRSEAAKLAAICQERAVTFVYAARDEARNSAALLKAYIEENFRI